MMARGRRAYTRMEKNIVQLPGTTAAASADIYTFNLEGGEEECQIKRICWSTAANHQCVLKLGLFQDLPTVIGDFTDDKIIYATVGNTGAVGIINETTTVRVPRNWTLAIAVINTGGAAVDYNTVCQLNYLVLS